MATFKIPQELDSKLWPHQKTAIHFAARYLREPYESPTGLVRMPTGTGKTGVIAALSVAVPPAGWTLILTPWSNLCDQMIDDVEKQFWEERKWKPPKKPEVKRLYPSTLEDILVSRNQQLIVVATFATLVTIYKKHRDQYQELAGKLSQVIVDEGHYEPAVEWGRAVKQLRSPTLLLTATPYRNDLKLFQVKKGDVHHYTHAAAEAEGVIRKVKFRPIGMNEPSDKQLRSWCALFADFWKGSHTKKFHSEPRAIICCARMATVRLVTSHLRDLGINALGIHERFNREKKKKEWLKRETPKPADVPFDVWVHQNKLTEGLDDHRFCVVAVLNRIRNDRKLIQQIGRVLRRTPERGGQGQALILYSDDLPVERSWNNYRVFETQADFVESERYREILDVVLKKQPTMEYFGGRFRSRFNPDSHDLRSEILLRASAAVRRIRPSFTFPEFAGFTSDFLLLEDRILLGPDKDALSESDDSRLWIYAVFGNSPLLIQHSQYEIRLGAMAAVKHDDLLFLVDTEGAYPAKYLNEHTKKLGDDELGRIFSKEIVAREVSLANPFPIGATVHRSTIVADDLNATPAQLTDAARVVSRVRATSLPEKRGLLPRRQYVGFRQGRVSEQIRSIERDAFSLNEFIDWTRGLSHFIQAEKRKPPEFFRRYLPRIAPPSVVVPQFLVVNLFEGNVELQNEEGRTIELVESIIEVGGKRHEDAESLRFPFELHYREVGKREADPIEATLAYEPVSERFRVHGDDLNSEILVNNTDTDEAEGLATYLNNNDEAFTVVLQGADTYYADESFYQVDYTYAEERLSDLLTPVDMLRNATSEKEIVRAKTRWSDLSLFGGIADQRAGSLITQEFGRPEFLFCDDLGKEVSDFVCASFSEQKIAFIHAKHGKDRKVSASALHDVFSQAHKNLGVLSRGGSKPAHLDRWNRDSLWWPGTKIHRWLIDSPSLPVRDHLWEKIRTEILDHPDGVKQIWLVLGQTLDKAAFLDRLGDREKRDAVTGHIVHLLSGLQAACIQLDVGLRVFCHTTL